MSTVAERRQKKYKRGRNITWVVVTLVLSLILSSYAARSMVGAAFPVVFQIVLMVAFQMFQMIAYFGFMMYYLSGAKSEKIFPGDAKSVTLEDYKGQPIVLERAEYLVRVLEGFDHIRKMGGEAPKGVLLVGAPGTGKTYLARCMAGSAGVPFLLLDSSGLVSMFMGMGSIRVRRFFSQLRKYAKRYGSCVAFLDELDAIGSSRGGVEGGGMGMGAGMFGRMGGMGVLNTLLSQMDGLGESHGWFKKKLYGWLNMDLPKPDYCILVMGSTNRPAVLDSALTRAGRFDMQLRILPPSTAGLEEVIRYYLSQVEHEPDINTRRVAEALKGNTPADIRTTIKRNAIVTAEHEGRERITEEDIYLGAWEAVLGIEVPYAEPNARDQESVALHEAGHAVAAWALFPELRVLYASIVPHAGTGRMGHSLGVVIPRLDEERQALPLDFLARRVVMSIAGREGAAVAGRMELGFMGDRRNIQHTMVNLIAEGYFGYAASIKAGMGGPNPLAGVSESVQVALDEFLERAAVVARDILTVNADVHRALTDLLVKEGTLTAKTLDDFLAEHPVTPPTSIEWVWKKECKDG